MKKFLVLNSHSDDEVPYLISIKRARDQFCTRVEWISNGDSNVDNPSIREAESREVLISLLGFAKDQLHFYGFSEKGFYNALLNSKADEYFERILKEIKIVRGRFRKFAPEIVLTNFPDGGNSRHLFTSWLTTNVLASGKEMILGNPKQLYDKNINLFIGRLPEGWLEKLDFATPANLPEIKLKKGILTPKKNERGIMEEMLRNSKYYRSQRKSNQHLFEALFKKKFYLKEEIYKLKTPIDYEKLDLPIISFEEFGRKMKHSKIIEFRKHFLPLIKKLESKLT